MTAPAKINKSRIVLFCLLAAAVLLAISPFAATRAVNTAFVKNRLAAQIEKQTDLKLEISDFSIALFPLPGVRMENLSVRPLEGVQIRIGTIAFTVDLHQLLKKKIGIGKIALEKPVFEFDLASLVQNSKNAPTPVDLAKLFDHLDDAFTFLPEDQNSLTFDIEAARGPFFGDMDATIMFQRNQRRFRVDITLARMRFSPDAIGGPEFKKYFNLSDVSAGKVILHADISAGPSVTGKCRLLDLALQTEDGTPVMTIPETGLDVNFSPDGLGIKMSPADLSYPRARIGIDFSHSPGKKQAKVIFSGNQVHVDQAREMSQTVFRNLDVPRILFEILLGGVAPEISVSFSGTDPGQMLTPENLDLSGIIQNGKVHIPQTDLITEDLNGRIKVKSGILSVDAEAGRIKSTKLLKGNLEVDLIHHEDEPFHGNFELDVDLGMLPDTLAHLLPDTVLAGEMQKVSSLQGRCHADLGLDLKTGAEFPEVTVKTDAFNGKGRYERIPGEIRVGNVSIEYQPEKFQVKNLKAKTSLGKIRESTFSVKPDPPYTLNIENSSARLDISRFLPWLSRHSKIRNFISPYVLGRGEMDVHTLALTGPALEPEKWQYHATGQVQHLSLMTEKKSEHIRELSSQWEISNQHLQFQKLDAVVNDLPDIAAIREDAYLNSIQTPFHLKDVLFKTGQKSPAQFKGTARFHEQQVLTLDLKGRTLNSLKPYLFELIDPGISDAHVRLEHAESDLKFDFSGKLETQSLKKLIKPNSALSDRLDSVTEGQPVTISEGDDHVLNISVPTLNLNMFQFNDDFSFGQQLLSDNLINFSADRLIYKSLRFTNVDTKISFKPDHSYLRLKQADLCGLQIQGYFNIKDHKVFANFPITAENRESVEPLLACLLEKQHFMDGAYSMKGHLSASEIPLKMLSKSTEGDFQFHAQEGRIYQLTLLSRILSVLNVSKVFKGKIPDVTQKGFAYKTITVKADIKESVIHLTEAVIDGQDMTMIFSGTIDPVNDSLNLTCLVAPFKTVDLIIEKIPIINTLLNNRLISVPVKATGKLSDPTVIPLHPTAVGKGLIDMMSNIVKSPITLLEKIAGEKEEEKEE